MRKGSGSYGTVATLAHRQVWGNKLGLFLHPSTEQELLGEQVLYKVLRTVMEGTILTGKFMCVCICLTACFSTTSVVLSQDIQALPSLEFHVQMNILCNS